MNTILMDTAPPVITGAPRMNILLIETSVNDYATIVGALKPNVLYVLFDSAVDTFASLNAKIACVAPTEGFDAVGIVKHGNATGADYKLLEAQVTPAVLRNVEAEDPLLSSWSELTDFFGNLKTLYTVSTIDLLSCALYGNPGWVYGLIQLEKTLGVNFRASTNNVGNIASGGDWLMESDGVDIQTVYFTDAILGYGFLLGLLTIPSSFSVSSACASNLFNITWTAPTSDGGSAITKYILTINSTSFSLDLPVSTYPPDITYTIQADIGFSIGTWAFFYLCAYNSAGNGPNQIRSCRVLGPPATPINPIITGVGSTEYYIYSSTPLSDTDFPNVSSTTVRILKDGAFGTLVYTQRNDDVFFPQKYGVRITGINNITELSPSILYTVLIGHANTCCVGDNVPVNFANAGTFTLPGVPTAPTSPQAVASTTVSGQVTVSWGLASSSPALYKYTVYYSSDAVNYTYSANITTFTNLSYNVTGLTGGVSYTFKITASNATYGEGPGAVTSSPVTPKQPPDAPTALSVNITGTGTQAVISFTPPVYDGGSIITGYTVISSPAGPTGGGAGTSSPITMSGLVVGTTYTFAVTAVNALGTGTAGIARPIDAPTALFVNITGTQAIISFTPPVYDGGSTITGYTVTSSPAGPIGGGVGTSSPITMSGLVDGTKYTFTVTAVNALGTGTSRLSLPVMYTPYLSWVTQTPLMNTSADETVPSVAVDSLGNVYVAYLTLGTVSGGTRLDAVAATNICVFKMDTSGAMVWIKETSLMNTDTEEYYPTVTADSIGNVYISYQSRGTVSGGTKMDAATNFNICVFKMDTFGNMVWIKETELMNTTNDDTRSSVAVDSNGNVYVSYQSLGTVSSGTRLDTPVNYTNICVFKMDTFGNMVWIKETALMNTPSMDSYPKIAVDSAGNVYVSYYTLGTVSGGTKMDAATNFNICVFKMDTFGNMVWIKETGLMNTTLDDSSPSVAVDSNGNVYVSYQSMGTVSGGTKMDVATVYNICVFKMDTFGNMVWIKETKLMNTTLDDSNPSVAVDSSGNVYVSYQTPGTVSDGNVQGGSDIVIFGMDNAGAMVWIRESVNVNTLVNDTVPAIVVTKTGVIYVSYQTAGAVNGATSSGGSDIVVLKMTQPPAAPTALSVNITGDGTQAIISFTPPVYTGTSIITGYTVTSSPAGPIGGGAGTSSPITVSGLVVGTTYTFAVAAFSEAGTGERAVSLQVIYAPYLSWVTQTPLMNTSASEAVPSVAVDSAGNVYVSYTSYGTVSGGTKMDSAGINNICVFKMDTFGNMVWIKETELMNTTLVDTYSSVAVDISGNVYVSYTSYGTVSGGTRLDTLTNYYNICVFKMDTFGNMVWIKETKLMNTTLDDTFPSVAVDSFGNVYVSYQSLGTVSSGTRLDTPTNYTNICVFKMDTFGNMVWIKETELMNTPSMDSYPKIAVDSAGNVYVSYYTNGTVSGGTKMDAAGVWNICVFKMDTYGNMVWIKETALMNTDSTDWNPTIAVDSAGNVYVSYYTNGTVSGGTRMDAAGVWNICVFKLNTYGAMVWIKETALMNTTLNDTTPSVAVDSSGNVYVSYQTPGTVSGGGVQGGSDIVMFKLDTYGAMVWIRESVNVNTIAADTSPTIAVTKTGAIYVSYQTAATGAVNGTTSSGGTDIVVLKMEDPLPPDAPIIITANSPSVGTVFLQWAAPNNNGGQPITRYIVTVLPIKQLVYVTPDQTSVTISGLRARTYTFTVTASNRYTNSAASVRSSKVGVSEDKSTYKYMLLNTPFTFKVFTAFRII